MSDLLQTRKLYIDSRFLRAGTPSSFDFELQEILELPRDTVAYITEFTAVCGSKDGGAAGCSREAMLRAAMT